MNSLSAVIVAKNNPSKIFQTIESIQSIVSEILIIDIGLDYSISEKLKTITQIKIIPWKNPAHFIELIRQEIFDLAHSDYILYMDPDEMLTEELAALIQSNFEKYDFISIPRKNIIFERWIQHARWWPDYQVRVFNRKKVTWPKTLHAQPETQGTGLTLDAQENLAIVHYNYLNLDEYMVKMTRYAKSEAQKKVELKEELTLKTTVQKSLSEFMSRFFADKGYKEGMHGFTLSFLQMMYYFLVYFYYWEAQKYPSINTNELVDESHTFFKQGLKETTFWVQNESIKHIPLKDKVAQKISALL